MKKVLLVLLSAFLLIVPSAAVEAYPERPITMLVNFSAGGGTDLASRALADAASRILGQPIAVSNVPGGSGSVGVAELMNRSSDGYTIGVATLAPLAIVPWQMEVPYTPDDFEYICAFGQYGYGLVVRAESPYQTVEDLLDAAKNTGRMNFGATGYPQPFAMEALGEISGVEFIYVTYASTPELITDVMGGFIECALADQTSFTPQVRSGQIRLLASASDRRWDSAPEVPTLQELGYDIALLSYMGLATPAGVDPEILRTLRDAFAAASEDEAYREILSNSNLVFTYLSGEEYEKLVRETHEENRLYFTGRD